MCQEGPAGLLGPTLISWGPFPSGIFHGWPLLCLCVVGGGSAPC